MADSLSVGDAISVIVEAIRSDRNSIKFEGYDVYLMFIWRIWRDRHKDQRSDPSKIFYAAAWELCRRGILRPGVRNPREKSTDDGRDGMGFSITPLGEQWLAEVSDLEFIPPEPSAIGQLLSQFRVPFGEGYHQRAQEAARCYGAHANLAACAMAGAAAEAILLATAIAKTADEEKVLKVYHSTSGRRRAMELVVGQASAHLERQFRSATSLLDYWRDNAAHGAVSAISELEAHDALARLLRFAQFAADNWGELTSQSLPGRRELGDAGTISTRLGT